MRQLFWIALGSALGGVLRLANDRVIGRIFDGAFPLSTFLVNVAGSFLIGWIVGRWFKEGTLLTHPHKWHFWVTGFCGGFTTFSSYAWQIMHLIQNGDGQLAGIYAALSIGCGLIAVWLGLSIGMRKHLSVH